jgi:regulatory protein
MPDGQARGRRRQPAGPSSSERPDAWQVALKQLAVRARSTHEVRQALARRGYPSEDIARVIARLTAARYLNDAEFAITWVSMRARRGAVGPLRLTRELHAKGIAEGEIQAALRAVSGENDPGEAVREAARRKLKSLAGLPAEVARRRLAAYLARRGFEGDLIVSTCREQVPFAHETE